MDQCDFDFTAYGDAQVETRPGGLACTNVTGRVQLLSHLRQHTGEIMNGAVWRTTKNVETYNLANYAMTNSSGKRIMHSVTCIWAFPKVEFLPTIEANFGAQRRKHILKVAVPPPQDIHHGQFMP
jgi:hypothetical protein